MTSKVDHPPILSIPIFQSHTEEIACTEQDKDNKLEQIAESLSCLYKNMLTLSDEERKTCSPHSYRFHQFKISLSNTELKIFKKAFIEVFLDCFKEEEIQSEISPVSKYCSFAIRHKDLNEQDIIIKAALKAGLAQKYRDCGFEIFFPELGHTEVLYNKVLKTFKIKISA